MFSIVKNGYEITWKKIRIVCTIFGFQDRFYLRIHLSCLVLLPFRRGHMVFSIFHSVVRAREREEKGKRYSKEEDGYIRGYIRRMVGNIGQRWKTRRNGGGEASPRKINISIGKVQESRPFIYLRALFHFFLFSYPFSSSANLTKTVLLLLLERERVYLTVQIGRKGDEEKQGERRKRVFPRENSIWHLQDSLEVAGRFLINSTSNPVSFETTASNGIFYRVRLVRKIPTGTIAQTNY